MNSSDPLNKFGSGTWLVSLGIQTEYGCRSNAGVVAGQLNCRLAANGRTGLDNREALT